MRVQYAWIIIPADVKGQPCFHILQCCVCVCVCVCTRMHVLIHTSKYPFCCSSPHSLETGSFMEPGVIPVSINSRDPPASAHCKGRCGHANFLCGCWDHNTANVFNHWVISVAPHCPLMFWSLQTFSFDVVPTPTLVTATTNVETFFQEQALIEESKFWKTLVPLHYPRLCI